MRHSENGEASSNNELCLNKQKLSALSNCFMCDVNSNAVQQKATFINYEDLSGIWKLNIK